MSPHTTSHAPHLPAIDDFDDRGWPVNLLLVLLAAASGGVIAAHGDFESTVIWQNAWAQLGALALVTLLVIGAARLISAHIQRRMQLALLLSLVIHLVMSLGLYRWEIQPVHVNDEGIVARPYEPVLMPDYHTPDAHEATPNELQMFQEPVEANPQRVATKAEERQSQPEEQVTRPREMKKQEKAEQQAQPLELARAEVSAPRRAEQQAEQKRAEMVRPEPQLSPAERATVLRSAATAHEDLSPAQTQRQAASATPQANMPEAQTQLSQRAAPTPQLPDRQASSAQQPMNTRLELAMLNRQERSQPVMAEPNAAVPTLNNPTVTRDTTVRPLEPTGRFTGAASQTTAAPMTAAMNNAPASVAAPAATPSRTATLPGAGQPTAAGEPMIRTHGISGAEAATMPQERAPAVVGMHGTAGHRQASAGSPGTTGSQAAGELQAAPGSFGQRASSAAGQLAAGSSLGAPGATQLGPMGAGSSFGASGAQSEATGAGGAAGLLHGAGAMAAVRNGADNEPASPSDYVGARTMPGAGGAPQRAAPAGDGMGQLSVPQLAARPSTGSPGGNDSRPSGTRGALALGPASGMGRRSTIESNAGGALARSSIGQPAPSRSETPGEAGGLTGSTAADAGVPLRRARPESEVVHAATPRLILEKAGGQQAVDAHVRDTAVAGLKQRDRSRRGETARAYGGTEGTERAVELGLAFLARVQSADGSWSLHAFNAGAETGDPSGMIMQSNTAGTGLALLAFLGAGYTHTDGKYRDVVGRGLQHLVSRQKPDGDLFVPLDQRSALNVWLYSHGIASIALCEAYGMTRDAQLRAPAQNALNFIIAAQHPTDGGWRYAPRQGSDTSVSGWQVMALKSGELAGLAVPSTTYAKVSHWLDEAQGAGGDPAHYAYRPRSTQASQREPSRVMTAEALLMRQYLGWRRDQPSMVEGARWLGRQLPEYGRATAARPSGQRDAYYWYYATQVMFQMQGEYWEQWNGALRTLLVDSQVQSGPLAGSWDPARPVPDRWGEFGGRIYITALDLLMLEVYYRHLPIYQTLEGPEER
ncbi:MAG: hypothetical protein JSS27_18680 [Planctomycetes bacterium]|nr:hypothetical protein [Planctomycetota bacterium]